MPHVTRPTLHIFNEWWTVPTSEVVKTPEQIYPWHPRAPHKTNHGDCKEKLERRERRVQTMSGSTTTIQVHDLENQNWKMVLRDKISQVRYIYYVHLCRHTHSDHTCAWFSTKAVSQLYTTLPTDRPIKLDLSEIHFPCDISSYSSILSSMCGWDIVCHIL